MMGRQPSAAIKQHCAGSVIANAYRWARPTVDQLILYRPATAVDFLQADAATKHFVALAARGWEVRHDRSEPELQRLADDIFLRPRVTVLGELWGTGFGKLNFLKRLPGRILQRRHYDDLVQIMRDPWRRSLLRQCTMLSPVEIDLIAHLDQPTLAAASVRQVSRIGIKLFDYVIAVMHRHRPGLDQAELLRLLRELGHTADLSTWLRRVLCNANLPPAPWDDAATITPLRTVADIQLTGIELRNCLFDPDRSLAAVLGECCYYRVKGRYGPAVVAVVFDTLLGEWRIEAYRGPGNAKVTPATAKHIVAEFAEVGIRFFGECPRERALDGLDAFHPPP